jgi:hypothetical protein
VSTSYDALAEALGSKQITYAPGYPLEEEDGNADSLRAAAVETARAADVALVFAGLPPASETEGSDRTTLQMPDAHNRPIEAVAEAQPSTGVVLSNGSAVAMPWRSAPKAILETWLAGQAGGRAKADVLLGRTNPSGKLSSTFPKQRSDAPAYINFPGTDREVLYGERFFVGYRHYDERDIEPLYPFGHGLSYTTFEVSDLSLDADSPPTAGAPGLPGSGTSRKWPSPRGRPKRCSLPFRRGTSPPGIPAGTDGPSRAGPTRCAWAHPRAIFHCGRQSRLRGPLQTRGRCSTDTPPSASGSKIRKVDR